MTLAALEPCDWPDDPDELDRQLEQAWLDLHGPTAIPRHLRAYRDVENVTLIGEFL
ncbi:hypothetical protein ACPB9J_16000 [Streptomyces lavendulocolor]|uniref:hypothetical protein n=1 Tax=Streptomyces lavendulocolor TaxID=67316 RepID=UPI003C2E6180